MHIRTCFRAWHITLLKPCVFQVRDMMQAFGALRTCDLVLDRATGTSKGYVFCEYMEALHTEIALQGLAAITINGAGDVFCREGGRGLGRD